METDMKKILLSVAISLSVLSAAPAMAATPAFSASQMAQVKITELSFKEVMRQFYSGRMGQQFVDDEYIESMPNIGLDSVNSDGERTVALMHPVMMYKNTAGEPRYLVTIEKVQVNSGSLVQCHACDATADLYSFKKLSNGQFQLVSRTPKNVEFSSSWGRVGLYAEDIKEGLQLGNIIMQGSLASRIIGVLEVQFSLHMLSSIGVLRRKNFYKILKT